MKTLSSTVILSIILTVSLMQQLVAQDMAGVTGAKYSSSHSAILNPSLPVLSPFYLDINVASGSIFAENNYLYIRRDENKFRRFFSPAPVQSDILINTDRQWYSDYNTPGLKSGFISARVIGPSIYLGLGPHSFGISYSLRSVTSVHNIPPALAKFLYEGMYYPSMHDIRYVHDDKMSFASLNWTELGFSYSGIVSVINKNIWSIGLTAKTLQGIAGISIYSDHLDYMVAGYDTLKIFSADAKGGVALPLNYDNNKINPGFKGAGLGMDLGVTFERKKSAVGWLSTYHRPCAQSYVSYLYRIGVSLLDFGKIRFDENGLPFELHNDSLYWPGIKRIGNTTIRRMTDTLSNRFFGNPTELIKGNEVSVCLPASLCVHGDYNFNSNWFASVLIIVPVNTGSRSAVIRPSVLNAGLRYETKQASAGINATLQGIYGVETSSIHRLQIGINGRFHNFFIGTGNIISFLRLTDYTGTDLYAGVRLSLSKGRCRHTGFKCPDFF